MRSSFRLRDALACILTLPASILITCCLFLPHTRSCQSRIETPFDAGTWIVIVPLVFLGLLPAAWHLAPRTTRLRRELPEHVLSFTLLALALVVVTIPIAIFLMWGYAKRSFRGELLVAMCSATCVMLWLACYPLITLFDVWLPAAAWTWGAAAVELAGFLLWVSAAASRLRRDRAPAIHHDVCV